MSILERLKFAWASLFTIGGNELPEGGRSSQENVGGSFSNYLSRYGSVSPVINFEMLAALKNLYLYNPDVSQYVTNIVNLGNTGHKLQIAAQSSTAEAAVARLNEAATRIYLHGAGVDGLINQYLTQIAWSGALSSEDVVNFGGRRVEKVVMVPVESIRFRYLDGEYKPFQKTNRFDRKASAGDSPGLIPLNPFTYQYLALSTIENSPYAKPPGSAAVEAIIDVQKPILDNVKYIAKKLGILGLVTALVTAPPKRPGETDDEHQSRAKKYLAAVRDSLTGNFSNGLLVAYRDYKFEHTNVSAGAQGAYDINRMSEEQVMSGLGMQPAFFGRTDSTTETYADVVYNLLLALVFNMVRLAKRRQEQTYRLDLRLAAIEIDSVSLAFNKAHSRDPLKEAQADESRVRTVLLKVEKGVISPDDGAQELGYESAYDPELMTANPSLASALQAVSFSPDMKPTKILNLRFNRESQKYVYVPDVITLGAGNDKLSGSTSIESLKKNN